MANKVHKSSSEYMSQQKVERPGKPVLYIGMGGKTFTCPTCSREYSKGMMYDHKGDYFCSRNCIPSQENSVTN